MDAAGDLFVADNSNNRVVKLSPPSVTATPSPLSGSTATAVSAALNRLAPDTTYFYRAVAASAAGIVADAQQPPQSFTTLTPPIVVTQAADPVSATQATLNASINPEGSTTKASFQYSTDPAFTPSVQTTFGSGYNSTSVAVDAVGDVFVADFASGAVKKIPADGGAVQTLGSGFGSLFSIAADAAGDVFFADPNSGAVKEIPAGGGAIQTLGAGFSSLSSVAADAAGDVFVADGLNSDVKEIPADGGGIRTLSSSVLAPMGVAVDAAGNVFVIERTPAPQFQIVVAEIPADGGAVQTIGSGFNQPVSIAADAAGNVFVADLGANAVEEIPAGGGAVKTLGSGFSSPSEVAVDAAGDVFVADSGNNRVVELSPPSVTATPPSLRGSTATAVSASLTGLTPGTTYFYRAVAVSAGGIVADVQQRPRSFTTPLMDVAATAASSITATGAALNATVNPQGSAATVSFQYSTDPAFTPTVQAVLGSGFVNPSGVAVDAAGDVLIADTFNHAVKEIPAGGGAIQTLGSGFSSPHGVAVDAAGDVFVADFLTGDVNEIPAGGGAVLTLSSNFDIPRGVAVDAAGNVFVADFGDGAVKEIPAGGGPIQTLGSGFDVPMGVAVDAAGDVFVADFDSNAIKEIPAGGGAIQTLGSGFSGPSGVAVDAAGNLFVADAGNNAVKEIPAGGGAILTLGSGFSSPNGVAVDAAGDVFVADSGNNRVVELSPPSVAATPSPIGGSTTKTFAASLNGLTRGHDVLLPRRGRQRRRIVVDAQQPPQSFTTLTPPTVVTGTADSISASGAALNATVNPQGSTATVSFQYSTDPAFTPTVQAVLGSGFVNPSGVAVDAAGDIFIADTSNGAIKEISAGGAIQTLAAGLLQPTDVAVDAAGDLFVGSASLNAVVEFPAGGGPIQALGSGFNGPQGVAVDAAGDVFIADSVNNAIKEIPAGGSAIQTLGSGFNYPTGVAVDAAGNVFVADMDNNAVKEIPAGGGAIQTLGSGFDQPTNVAVDAAGNVFVADSGNNAVKEIPAGGGPIQTLGTGFSYPTGVAVDAAGDVFVADNSNNRVVELSPPNVTATPASLGGSSTADVSAALTNLTPGTTYYYRAVASSAAGIVADAQQPPQSFTTPSITWTNPADIQYGTPLGSAQLDAMASIPGSFSYTLADDTTAADGVVLNAGQSQVLNVTFTPTDSTHYATETAQATINVNPATLTVTADDKSRAFGQPNPTLTDTITGFVNGDNASVVSGAASLSTTATTSSPVGRYPITAALGTLNAANYTFAFQNGTLTVATNSQGAFGLAEDVYVIGSGTVSVSAANGVLANDSAGTAHGCRRRRDWRQGRHVHIPRRRFVHLFAARQLSGL